MGTELRTCWICGAIIGDDNPDGIGSSCRKVWTKAQRDAFFHFCGLDYWIAKASKWVDVFIQLFKNVKFRSAFKKSFYTSIVSNTEKKISKKQLSIIIEMIGQKNYHLKDETIDEVKSIFCIMEQKFLRELTQEQSDYIANCAKKYYGENSRKKG